jgi:adenine-specific DNA methylase
MKGGKNHQNLPSNWHERENLRNKGQFWTPDWIAEAMVAYAVVDSQLLFDPATGEGAFYKALIKHNSLSAEKVGFYGTDIDENILNSDIYKNNSCVIELKDFIFCPPDRKFRSIVANPPYIRHHRLSNDLKFQLKKICRRILGFTIDGRAGLHIYFLIQALDLLENGGRLAFIMPSDTVEGVFAKKLWRWLTGQFRLECVALFSPEATPFPNVDTNALIFFIKKDQPHKRFMWVKSDKPNSDDLKEFVMSGFHLKKDSEDSLEVISRDLDEALQTGLSRPPLIHHSDYKLSDFARVMRGIATGANDFFFLTRKKADELGISKVFLKPAVGRTRDITGSYITENDLATIDKKGRPTLLFSPDGRKLDEFPPKVQKYLLYGESLNLNEKALIKTRKPWYKMEQRDVPKFLFAYLGRRHSRFIRNKANVLPLTSFLCVYPHSDNDKFINCLWEIINDPETLDNLKLVGKSYGSGAIKVEPRALETLPIPERLANKINYSAANMKFKQSLLF